MKRSSTYPINPNTHHEDDVESRQRFNSHEGVDESYFIDTFAAHGADGAAVVHNIASFLTLSDAASLVYGDGDDEEESDAEDSWAVGVDAAGHDSLSWTTTLSIATPLTPALVALSPGVTPHLLSAEDDEYYQEAESPATDTSSQEIKDLLRERRWRWAQEKISAAVFSHPRSLRSFCLEAVQKAKEIQQARKREEEQIRAAVAASKDEPPPETLVEPCGQSRGSICTRKRHRKRKKKKDIRVIFVHDLVDLILDQVPLSVLIDICEALGETCIDTTAASFHLTVVSVRNIVSAIVHTICNVWDAVQNFNPFQLLEAIISLQFSAMGKTSEVIVSGIQSVATGVGSASSMALYRLSASNKSLKLSSNSLEKQGRRGPSNLILNKKLLKKLSAVNDAALVVSYQETGDDTCGLTRQAVSRTRKMMHYKVSLRPFVATVAAKPQLGKDGDDHCKDGWHDTSFDDGSSSFGQHDSGDDGSPFMCTPQSFPATPRARHQLMSQRSLAYDDTVFLVRDRLRVHDALDSENERTRQRASALQREKCLAVFDCKDEASTGIQLSLGRHLATKVGNMYYSTTRSQIPVLRNAFVYFEMTVLEPGRRDFVIEPASLSIGLSTKDMPPNMLVGAWQGSIGLCTTGLTLLAGQWNPQPDPSVSAYGFRATVGCLVYLDDSTTVETWDGLMARATVRFTVRVKPNDNQVVVCPPATSLPMSVGVNSNTESAAGEQENSVASDKDGDSRGDLPEPTNLRLLVPSAEDLYPTVTLQSAATGVLCRFSSEDIIATTRESIGAPPGVAVYAVDGSVILEEKESTIRSDTSVVVKEGPNPNEST
jgi:hypothetical protein